MRTTITLTSQAEALLRHVMASRGVSFKDAVNDAIVTALTVDRPAQLYETPTFSLGPPRVNLDRALSLAAELEDEELLRKRAAGK